MSSFISNPFELIKDCCDHHNLDMTMYGPLLYHHLCVVYSNFYIRLLCQFLVFCDFMIMPLHYKLLENSEEPHTKIQCHFSGLVIITCHVTRGKYIVLLLILPLHYYLQLRI